MKNLLVLLLFLAARTGNAQMMVLYVADTKADCMGLSPMQCLQVKEKPAEPYSLFYSSIDGFKYEEGYSYKLEVIKTRQADPAPDAAAYKYYLLRVVTKEKSVHYNEKATPVPNQLILYLSKINRNGKLENTGNGKMPDIYFDLKARKVSGNNGCNRYFGKVTVANGAIKFSALASTRIACLNNRTEALFMKHLTSVNRFVMKGQTLKLLKDSEVMLQFYLPAK